MGDIVVTLPYKNVRKQVIRIKSNDKVVLRHVEGLPNDLKELGEEEDKHNLIYVKRKLYEEQSIIIVPKPCKEKSVPMHIHMEDFGTMPIYSDNYFNARCRCRQKIGNDPFFIIISIYETAKQKTSIGLWVRKGDDVNYIKLLVRSRFLEAKLDIEWIHLFDTMWWATKSTFCNDSVVETLEETMADGEFFLRPSFQFSAGDQVSVGDHVCKRGKIESTIGKSGYHYMVKFEDQQERIYRCDELSMYIDKHFVCPISQDFMCDPIIDCYGHTYNRKEWLQWVNIKGLRSTSPNTNGVYAKHLKSKYRKEKILLCDVKDHVVVNFSLKSNPTWIQIDAWRQWDAKRAE